MGKKLYRWLMQKSTDAEMPPSRYIRRMIELEAIRDVQRTPKNGSHAAD
jgi:hypothetical protein